MNLHSSSPKTDLKEETPDQFMIR